MKLNLDATKPSVCKEDVLMCIFKEVPKFVPDDQEGFKSESSWVGGSHQDFVVGRHGNPAVIPESKKSTVAIDNLEQDETTENKQSTQERIKENLPSTESTKEIEIWSSHLSSKESLPDIAYKLQQMCRKLKMSTKPIDNPPFEVKDSSLPMNTKNYTKADVMRLINDVQSSLLECSIILVTHKLNNKVQKWEEEESQVNDTPSDNDVLFEQIVAEEETREGASKLCLALGRLVTKYLKTK